MAIFSPPSLSWLGGEGGSGSDNGSAAEANGGGGGGSPRDDADDGADAGAEIADLVGDLLEQEGQAMSPWWDAKAPPSHADNAEAPPPSPPSPPSPPGGLSRALTTLGTVGTSLSSLFSKAPPPLLSGAPHQRAAVFPRPAPPAQPHQTLHQTLLPGVTAAAAAAQTTAAAAAAAVDTARTTEPPAAGTTRGRRRSTLSRRQRQQVESAVLAPLSAPGSTYLHLPPPSSRGSARPAQSLRRELWCGRRPARHPCPLCDFQFPGFAACRAPQGQRLGRRWRWRGRRSRWRSRC